MKIKATYVKREFHDSGSDGAPDYYILWFTKIEDEKGKKYPDKWIKETKLTQAAHFTKGVTYHITLSERFYKTDLDSVNMPYPIDISWGDERVYMKNGNSIIRVNKDGQEKNLSEPLFKRTGTENYILGFFNKFHKGILTEEQLIKMNSRGVFFSLSIIDPQDKRKSGGWGYSRNSQKNFIRIDQESQEAIDKEMSHIQSYPMWKEIISHFEIITNILPPKKRKK